MAKLRGLGRVPQVRRARWWVDTTGALDERRSRFQEKFRPREGFSRTGLDGEAMVG